MARQPQHIRAAVKRMVTILHEHFQAPRDEDQFVLGEVIKTLIWKHTEAVGGLGDKLLDCPVWSQQAVFAIVRQGVDEAVLELEHVETRASIKKALLAKDALSRLDEILCEPVTCVVTPEEHRRLSRNGVGWDRYRDATGGGILVGWLSKEDRRGLKVGSPTERQRVADKYEPSFRVPDQDHPPRDHVGCLGG